MQYVGGGIGQDSATDIPYQPPVVSSEERDSLASANQGLSTASQASCHVHRILYLLQLLISLYYKIFLQSDKLFSLSVALSSSSVLSALSSD